MRIEAISADSKTFTRLGIKNEFKAVIGVAVAFENVRKFQSDYVSFFEELKQEYPIDNFSNSPRLVFKSMDLRKYFGVSLCAEVMERFVRDIVSNNRLYVNFVYSTFMLPTRSNNVSLDTFKWIPYKTKKHSNKLKFITSLDFIDKLGSYYSYIPPWIVIRKAGVKRAKVLIDDMSSGVPETLAWEELITSGNEIRLVPKGDMVNPLISTADLLLGYLEWGILQYSVKLWGDLRTNSLFQALLKILGFDIDKVRTHYVGSNYIGYIIPRRRIKKGMYKFPDIHKINFLHKSLVLIFPEGVLPKKESSFIEASPIYSAILRYAHEIDAGVKFMSLDEDLELLENSDLREITLLLMGSGGNASCEYLRDILKFDINCVSVRDLLNKYPVNRWEGI